MQQKQKNPLNAVDIALQFCQEQASCVSYFELPALKNFHGFCVLVLQNSNNARDHTAIDASWWFDLGGLEDAL